MTTLERRHLSSRRFYGPYNVQSMRWRQRLRRHEKLCQDRFPNGTACRNYDTISNKRQCSVHVVVEPGTRNLKETMPHEIHNLKLVLHNVSLD